MDLVSMARTVWRHKLAVLPVVLLTAFGLTYVTALAPATYEVTASYVLIPPPFPPSPEDRLRDPSLADVRADNPFVRFSAPSVIVDLVARHTDSEQSREALLAAGADERFQVLPSNRFGFSSPIIDVNAVASTPESAMSTARLVSAAVERELHDLQAAQDVDDAYMYRPLLIDFPETPRLRLSNELRSVIAVLGLGGILAFFTVSVAEALQHRPSRAGHSAVLHTPPVHATAPHTAPVHTAPVHTAPVHTAPVHTAPVHAAPVHLAPGKAAERVVSTGKVRGAHYRRPQGSA